MRGQVQKSNQTVKLAVLDRLVLVFFTAGILFGGCGITRVADKLENVEVVGRNMEKLGKKLRDDVDKMMNLVLTILFGDSDNKGVLNLIEKQSINLGDEIRSLKTSIDRLETSIGDSETGVGKRLESLRAAFKSLEDKLDELKGLETALNDFRSTLDKSPLFGGGSDGK